MIKKGRCTECPSGMITLMSHEFVIKVVENEPDLICKEEHTWKCDHCGFQVITSNPVTRAQVDYYWKKGVNK